MKKLFIKICKLLGFEILDQNNFYSPTLEKNLNEDLTKSYIHINELKELGSFVSIKGPIFIVIFPGYLRKLFFGQKYPAL